MKLTTKSEYTILALIYIAKHQDKGYVRNQDICSKYDIPTKYLELLLSALKRDHIIVSKRGSTGGHKLALPAKDISVARIVRLMDGALAPTASVSKYYYSQTPLKHEKKILSAFLDIRNYISNKLEKLKLSDLI